MDEVPVTQQALVGTGVAHTHAVRCVSIGQTIRLGNRSHTSALRSIQSHAIGNLGLMHHGDPRGVGRRPMAIRTR